VILGGAYNEHQIKIKSKEKTMKKLFTTALAIAAISAATISLAGVANADSCSQASQDANKAFHQAAGFDPTGATKSLGNALNNYVRCDPNNPTPPVEDDPAPAPSPQPSQSSDSGASDSSGEGS
jgi:hypothetical protein